MNNFIKENIKSVYKKYADEAGPGNIVDPENWTIC